MEVQIGETVEKHLKKEKEVQGKGVKVLSLFFVDRVANYRSYDPQGNPVKGKFALAFEEALREFRQRPEYRGLLPFEVEEIGRGLRLPVNQQGERVFDENVNRLTTIANESYEDSDGKMLPKFNPKDPSFSLELPVEFAEVQADVIEVLESFRLEKHIKPTDQRWQGTPLLEQSGKPSNGGRPSSTAAGAVSGGDQRQPERELVQDH